MSSAVTTTKSSSIRCVASGSTLSRNVCMPKLIKHDRVVEDGWVLLPASATLIDVALHARVIVPFSLWESERAALRVRGDVGVWLAPTTARALRAGDVADLPLIAIDFPKFGDGRGFSTARLLRDRYGFTG